MAIDAYITAEACEAIARNHRREDVAQVCGIASDIIPVLEKALEPAPVEADAGFPDSAVSPSK